MLNRTARRARSHLLRWIIGVLAALILFALGLLAFEYWEAAFRAPIVHRADVAVRDWPKGTPPVTVLLVSDTHVAGPDMPPERLARIVDDLNGLKPDLILLAGDYISQKDYATRWYSAGQSVAPLARFRAPLGVVAVLGNHDHWADPAGFRRAFAAAGITLLANQAVRRGPLIIGGLDDSFSHHAKLPSTLAGMAALGAGAQILLTHAPDPARQLKAPLTAILAGHTHCGQVVLPFFGMPARDGHARHWLPCGQLDVGGTPLFVGAGLGTSIVPLRFNAPPDVWLIRFGPPKPR